MLLPPREMDVGFRGLVGEEREVGWDSVSLLSVWRIAVRCSALIDKRLLFRFESVKNVLVRFRKLLALATVEECDNAFDSQVLPRRRNVNEQIKRSTLAPRLVFISRLIIEILTRAVLLCG